MTLISRMTNLMGGSQCPSKKDVRIDSTAPDRKQASRLDVEGFFVAFKAWKHLKGSSAENVD